MSEIVIQDGITPVLNRMLQEIQNREPILRAVGQEVVSMTRQSFTNSALRPASWPPVKNKSGRPLYRTGALTRSITVARTSNDSVLVSTDRPYAMFHQFGTKGPYTIRAKMAGALAWAGARHPVKSVQHPGLPARPFFPFSASGTVAEYAKVRISRIIATALRKILRIQ